MTKILLPTWLAMVVVTVSPVAYPHHAMAEYDRARTVEYGGKVLSKFWKNPHVVLAVAVSENGKQVVWELEGNSVSSLARQGITANLINVGDEIRFAGNPSTRRPHIMIMTNLLLANGRELVMTFIGPRGKQQWPDARLVDLKAAGDTVTTAAARPSGLFRVWTWAKIDPWFFFPNDRLPLTKAAQAAAAKYNIYTDNPQLKCITPGMPSIMGNPYPLEFVKGIDSIELRLEEFDVVRTIHMDGSVDKNAKPSLMGYSVGRWENENTLVVTTTRINWRYLNRLGVPESPSTVVVERFTVDDGKGRLNYDLTMTDPAILTKPFTVNQDMVWKPGEVITRYDCTTQKRSVAGQ